MYKIFFLILLIVSASCSHSSSGSQNQEPQNKVANFDTLVNRIAIRIVDLTAPGGLSRIEDFLLIYDNPNQYIEDAKRCIASRVSSDLKKRICIYSMQNLPFENYMNFTKYCWGAFNEGLINERMLYLTIFPAPWKTDIRFAEAYQKREVKKLFEEMLMSKKLSDSSKEGIQYAASGEMLKSRIRMEE